MTPLAAQQDTDEIPSETLSEAMLAIEAGIEAALDGLKPLAEREHQQIEAAIAPGPRSQGSVAVPWVSTPDGLAALSATPTHRHGLDAYARVPA
jgi:hypothetical protein